MTTRMSLFILVLALVGVFGAPSAFAGEHPSATPGGLPEGHPSIADMEMPAGHAGAPSFEVQVVEFPSFDVVIMEGTLGGDIMGLFKEMFKQVDAQGLWREDTNIGAAFPYAMAQGWDDNTVMWVGVNKPEGAEVTEPLRNEPIPGGEYLMVMHIGPYDETEATWILAFEWAGQHGVEFSDGLSMERYLDDPEVVDGEKLRTEIYIPLVPGQGHAGMDYSQHGAKAEHGGHGVGHDENSVAGIGHGAPPFKVEAIEIGESFQVAYIEGNAGAEMESLFMGMIGEAMNQGLLTEETHVGAIYPTLMTEGYQGEKTVVYAAISLPGEFEAIEPFQMFDVPAGEYLFVEHVGSYAGLGGTWEAAFIWANEHGIKFGTGPALEHYANDPTLVPEDELITEILIPLLPGQKHIEGHEGAGHGAKANGHGAEHPGGAEHPSGSEHPKGNGGSEHPH